jgi:hypothetical protein
MLKLQIENNSIIKKIIWCGRIIDEWSDCCHVWKRWRRQNDNHS